MKNEPVEPEAHEPAISSITQSTSHMAALCRQKFEFLEAGVRPTAAWLAVRRSWGIRCTTFQADHQRRQPEVRQGAPGARSTAPPEREAREPCSRHHLPPGTLDT